MKNLIDVLKEFESQIKGITNEEDIQNKFEELAKELINHFYIKCGEKNIVLQK